MSDQKTLKCSRCSKDAQLMEADTPFCVADYYHYTALGQRLAKIKMSQRRKEKAA